MVFAGNIGSRPADALGSVAGLPHGLNSAVSAVFQKMYALERVENKRADAAQRRRIENELVQIRRQLMELRPADQRAAATVLIPWLNDQIADASSAAPTRAMDKRIEELKGMLRRLGVSTG